MTDQPASAALTANPGAPGDGELIDSALDRCPEIGPGPRTIVALPGGLTNRSYRVTLPTGRAYVARASSATAGLLAIDRGAECHDSRLAAASGVGPRVVACEPDNGISIVEWIEGRTLEPTDLDSADTLARVARTCRTLHRSGRFAADFDMFHVQRRYLAVVQEFGFRLPTGYLDFGPQVERIRAALDVQAAGTVPCHNDLLAANIMDDGDRLWLIDYEYAGNNDPCFELGNVWSEAALPEDRLAELVGAYFGYRSAALIARARLYAVLAKYGWTLWASIQAAASTVDFDFWSWGLEKYERAVAEFDGPNFNRLIDNVQQPDRPPRGSTQ